MAVKKFLVKDLQPIWPQILNRKKIHKRFNHVLSNGIWTIRADRKGFYFTEALEEEWKNFTQTNYCISVTSGSIALELALKALRIGKEDEVIVPTLGWYATAAAVCRIGAKVVFADVDINTSCIDYSSIKKYITPNTKAIIVVHLHCTLADLENIRKLCNDNKIVLVEDASQAHGAIYNYKPLGQIADVTCYSFNQEKLICGGEGGMITTNNKDIFDFLFNLRTDSCLSFNVDHIGISSGKQGANYCLSEFQALVILTSLEEFNYFNTIRNNNGDKLKYYLKEIKGIELLQTSKKTTRNSYYEFAIKILPDYSSLNIVELSDILSKQVGFPLHQTDIPVYRNLLFGKYENRDIFNNAEILYNNLLVFHHKYLLLEKNINLLTEAFFDIQQHYS